MTQTTEELLAQRQTTHGEYSEHARCTQAILRALQAERGWDGLPDIVRESLHMIAHKMGRIVTGHALVQDHYDDIAGYARLVSQRIAAEATTRPGRLAPGHSPGELWSRGGDLVVTAQQMLNLAGIDATLDACEPSPRELGQDTSDPSSMGLPEAPTDERRSVPRGLPLVTVSETVFIARGPFAGRRGVIVDIQPDRCLVKLEGYEYSNIALSNRRGHMVLLSEIGHIV